jgi:hypothetical protein
MYDELPEMARLLARQVEAPLTPAPEAKPVLQTPNPENSEQLHAVDTLFRQDAESSAVAGLFGLWTSAILLSDLAAEHFHTPAGEDVAKDEHRDEDTH